MARNDGTPVNLLALDGGGIRGICELRVLDEIMRRVQKAQNLSSLPRPCEYFHLMAGTSTGGLVAILLSRFKMTTKDAIEAYYDFSGKIFSKKNKKYRKSFFIGHEFGEAVLEKIIKDMVASHHIGHLMLDPEPLTQSKAFVCSQQAHQQGIPVRLRTYEPPRMTRNSSLSIPSPRGSSSSSSPSSTSTSSSLSSSTSTDIPLADNSSKEVDIMLSTSTMSDPWNEYRDIEIWEAARATTAAPSFFPPMVLSRGGSTRTFIDGAMGYNNPVYELIDEATALFGTDCTLSCLVSLGTGFTGLLTIGERKGISQKLDLLLNVKKMATDTETPHKNLQNQIRPELNTYFRFQLPSGAEKIGLHEYKKLDKLSQLMQAYIEQQSDEIDKVVQILVGKVKPRGITLGQIARSDHGQICPPKKDARGRPPVSEFFTGRREVLCRLAEAFCPDPKEPNSKRHHLLYGQPGVGKSQTASKFLDDYGHWFDIILWVDAMSQETLKAGFKELKGVCSEHGYVGDVTEQSWILVLDDGNKGAVLFTSQNRLMKPVQRSTTMIDVMSEADAVDLLLAGAQLEEEDANTREEAVKLAASLECLPLTLESAASTLRRKRYTISEYAKLLEEHRHNLLKNKSDSDSIPPVLQAVHASFDVTYKVLNTQAHDSSYESEAEAARYALKLLNLFSFYHNEGLMGGILKRAVENRPGNRRQDDFGVGAESFADLLATDDSGKWIESRWQLGVDLLIAYSLVKVMRDNQARRVYSMHGLVHDWARERMPDYLRCARAKAARVIIFDSINESQSNGDDILYSFKVLPHAQAAMKNTETIDIDDQLLLADQYYRYGLALDAAELSRLAFDSFVEAFEICHSHFGLFYERTLTMGESMAEAARRQGYLASAVGFTSKIFIARKRMYGPHPSTVRTGTRICVMGIELGEWDAVEHCLRFCVDKYFPLFANEELLTMKTALSIIFYHSGRIDEARDAFADVMQYANTRLGFAHPDTLKTINNLSVMRTRLGDYEEAEDMLQRLAVAEESIFGPSNGSLMERWYHHQGVALVTYHLGLRRQAIVKIDHCCRIFRGILTGDHIFTREAELQREAWIDEHERNLPIQTPTISRVIPMFRF
ncbi:FabD/lysophospholipase-like protein [Hypoxylon sp. FL1857]|nr:FabD/lysophospholipase-like protein [Hypoxylon sp. FL1857]